MNDTIVAISTALGIGAISIIRLSGEDAIKITNSIYKGTNLKKVSSHTINYGHIVKDTQIIDEVLVSIMKAPKTFTKEDVVEINCHGGIATTNKVLEIILSSGARIAEPGEFTKRAFLNGRIDLIEAEGIIDLINAKTEKSRSLAINQVDKKVSNLIVDLRQNIIEILANIEVNIDYPEYEDIELVTKEMIEKQVENFKNKLGNIIKKSEDSKIIKTGIDVAIIGRPNVGKSSLLNALINEDKAIVTEIEGTTRDIVEGTLILDGIIFNLIDTAGIRETSDLVEAIGVEKSKKKIEEADLVLIVLNNNQVMNKEEKRIIKLVKNKNYLVIINKVDLDSVINLENINKNNVIKTSLINQTGIEDLKLKMKQIFNLEKFEDDDYTYLSNARCIALLKEAMESINDIECALEADTPIDIIEIDLKNVWNKLGETIGVTYDNELVDQLFSQFCLGK